MTMKIKTDPTMFIASLEEQIPQLMEKADVPGLAVSLIRDANLLWQKGFGVKSVVSKEPVETDTVFEAASLSKPVFAYVALKLAERGTLGLDTPLIEYLPNLYRVDESPRFYIPDQSRQKIITTRHMLSHTARGTFSYSGSHYAYLQRIVEHLTGQPLAEYMKANLLEPFRMCDSSYIWNDKYELQAAQGHWQDGNPVEKMKPSQAGAEYTLHTTPAEYVKFITEIIDPSMNSESHLDKGSITEMRKPQVKINDSLSWGLGWGIEHSGCGDALWHWGDNDGFDSFAFYFLEQEIGIVILTNSDNGLRICRKILKAIGGQHFVFS